MPNRRVAENPEEARLDASMPLYVGDWLVSTEAMTSYERDGYMNLLCHAWRSRPPCTLPNDERKLQKLSRLDPDHWGEARAAILEKFVEVAGGRVQNVRQWAHWQRAVAAHEAAVARGRKGAMARWGITGDPSPELREELRRLVPKYPALKAWAGTKGSERGTLLVKLGQRVEGELALSSVDAFYAEVNAALVGMAGHRTATPEAIETGLRDWLATLAPCAPRKLGNYLAGREVRPGSTSPASSANGTGKGKGSTSRGAHAASKLDL